MPWMWHRLAYNAVPHVGKWKTLCATIAWSPLSSWDAMNVADMSRGEHHGRRVSTRGNPLWLQDARGGYGIQRGTKIDCASSGRGPDGNREHHWAAHGSDTYPRCYRDVGDA